MKSMTGYAYRESLINVSSIKDSSGKDSKSDSITASVEIKGYNSRFFDLTIYLPPWLSSLEQKIREYMISRFSRGKVELGIRIRKENAAVSVVINENAAASYKAAIEKMAKTLGISEQPNLSLLLGLEGVLEIETDRDAEKYWPFIEPLLAAAADSFEAERIREGKQTKEHILANLVLMEESVKSINVHVPEIESLIKENLRLRFTELLGDKIDENRILSETAVLLMKYTIAEELFRLSSHLSEFRLELERNPSPGKKLDFLCQEMNREVNTIGSKSQLLDVSRLVVEMKNALENIREQLRNVE